MEPTRYVVILLSLFRGVQKHIKNVSTSMRDKQLITNDNNCFEASYHLLAEGVLLIRFSMTNRCSLSEKKRCFETDLRR